MKIISKITEYCAKRRLYNELMQSEITRADFAAYTDYFETESNVLWTAAGRASYKLTSSCDISRGCILAPYYQTDVESANKTIASFTGRMARKLYNKAAQAAELKNTQKHR